MGWLDSRSYHGAHLCQCLLTWCCTTLETSCFSEWISVNHQFWLQADRVGASPLPFRSCPIYADERHSDSVVDTFWQHRGVATPWLCWLNISEFLTNLVRSASSLSLHAFLHIGKSSLGFDNLSSLFKNEKLSRSWRPYMISAGDTCQSLSEVFLRWSVALKNLSFPRLPNASTFDLSKLFAVWRLPLLCRLILYRTWIVIYLMRNIPGFQEFPCSTGRKLLFTITWYSLRYSKPRK